MSVRFIPGRSGTGKTSYCIKAIVDALLDSGDEQQLILLVPEQATYQAERAVLSDKRIAGYNRLHVLSFDRLQFLLLGKNTARPALSRIGQQMIIHRIFQEHKGQLKALRSSAGRPGLSRQMAETITELHQYAKTPEDMELLLSELEKDERNSLAVLKFSDIALVFKEYLKFIEGKYFDPDMQLSMACRAVAKADFVKGAKLWVDGFAGFTTAELAVLAELVKAASDSYIALCLDASNIDLAKPAIEKMDPAGLFYPTERTYAAVVEIIKKCKLQLAKPIILDKAARFSGGSELGHIERNIFKPQAGKLRTSGGIRIISAANSRAEVQFVARQIVQLVRQRKYRYRDIAVIASDIERYQHYIRGYFEDYGIPFFIDKRKLLNQHPLAGLICSALGAVVGGFSSGDVFAYLKNDLVAIERGDVDLLENYCVAFGVAGDDWVNRDEWRFQDEKEQKFDEKRVNQIRQKAIKPLLELRDKLYGDKQAGKVKAEEFTRIIFDFLEGLGVRERIGRWIAEANKQKDYASVDEHRQFYDRVVDIFDELAEVFCGQEMRCEEYLEIINSSFSQLSLAFIPPTLDQVLVGSIERSRHPDLKAVFLVGATQKQFPVPVVYRGLLSDDDRSCAEEADFELGPTVREVLSERQYLAYIAFTRPSEFLCVTYPLADEKGSAVVRSQFVDDLVSLFEDLEEESIAGERIAIEKVYNEGELGDLLCCGLGRDWHSDRRRGDDNELADLLDEMCGNAELSELGGRVLSAINYDNCARLDKDVVEGLFGERVRSSATKLGTFAACPYQYFARYLLELKEREEFKFEPLDVGVFYHRVLDAFLKYLNSEKKDIAAVDGDELLELLRGRIAEIVQTDSFISNFMHRSAHNAFIVHCTIEAVEDCVPAIAEMMRAGNFRPILSEVSFGQDNGVVNRWELGLSGGRLLCLEGKIDRIDIANIKGRRAAAVFDYKRRAKAFSWSELYYGLDMQLTLYMLAVRSVSNPEYKVEDVAGGFYMPVEVSATRTTLEEVAEKTGGFDYKARGIFDGRFFEYLDGVTKAGWSKFYNFYIKRGGDQYGNYEISGALKTEDFEKLLRFGEYKAVELAEEIVSGRIDIEPYRLNQMRACTFCKYKAVCRFDWQINDYNCLESVGKGRALERMGTEARESKK